jgi:hypothetical protein
MTRSTIILLCANLLFWGGFVVLGSDTIQHGYPNPVHARYYFFLPLAVLGAAILWPLCFVRARPLIRNIVPVATLLFLPIYILPYTGAI